MHDVDAEAYASTARSEAGGRNLSGAEAGAESRTAAVGLPKPEASRLMEAVVERNNLFRAYDRVVKNEGAPGVMDFRFPISSHGFSGTGYGYDRIC